jgi:hypothetical protein
VVPGGADAGGAAADGFAGGAVNGAAGGVSDAGAASGVAVTGAAKGVAVAGATNGVAVTGAAVEEAALLGCAAGPGAKGGVAVEGTGMAGGLAATTGSCEVMTWALPGGAATVVPSVVGTWASWRFATSCFAAWRLRAAVACTLLGLNGGGSVGFLT